MKMVVPIITLVGGIMILRVLGQISFLIMALVFLVLFIVAAPFLVIEYVFRKKDRHDWTRSTEAPKRDDIWTDRHKIRLPPDTAITARRNSSSESKSDRTTSGSGSTATDSAEKQ